MRSQYLSSLSNEEYEELRKELFNIQHGKCFICQKDMDLDIQEIDVDHVIPLANKGKDNKTNFALTHASCNRSKSDANLYIAQILYKIKALQEKVFKEEHRSASLKDILKSVDGSRYDFKYKIEDNKLVYSFSELDDNNIYKSEIYTDTLSNEQYCFVEVPLEYIYHDDLINPRGINASISKLIKEFRKGNPQLHISLARINDNKIMMFDGQHKAVARILLGERRIVVRLFLNPDVDRLIETNTNAGSTLRQIAFDKSIMRQLNNTLYKETIVRYQKEHGYNEDYYDFSEAQLVTYFKGENANIRKYIIDSIKHTITHSPDNKLRDYIDFDGKSKNLPISYSAFDKTFLSIFIDSKVILDTNLNYKSDEGENPREIEISQIIKLMNIIAEQVYIGKFNPEIGTTRIEQKIIDKKDTDITNDHLIAYRMSKEEVLYNWLQYLKRVIDSYFTNTGKIYQSNRLFQEIFPDVLWDNIRRFMKNLSELPLWCDKSMASTHFSGKQNYDFWRIVFETGNTQEGVQVLAKPLNFMDLIKEEY